MPVLGTGVAGLIRKRSITFSLWFRVGMVCHGIPLEEGDRTLQDLLGP